MPVVTLLAIVKAERDVSGCLPRSSTGVALPPGDRFDIAHCPAAVSNHDAFYATRRRRNRDSDGISISETNEKFIVPTRYIGFLTRRYFDVGWKWSTIDSVGRLD